MRIDEIIKQNELISNNLKTPFEKGKNTGSINPEASNSSNGKTMLLSKYAVGNSKKSR